MKRRAPKREVQRALLDAQGRSCARKRWFRDERSARGAADGATAREAREGNVGKTVRPYKCSRCTGWHLTSQPQRERA